MKDHQYCPVPESLQPVLLRYSRSLLENAFSERGGEAPGEPPAPTGEAIFLQPLGVFVTLRHGGELRGCIGSIAAEEPLVRALRRRTLDAAFRDRRFSPLRAAELPEVTIEHSLLSPMQPLGRTDQIRIGVDGVVLTVGSGRALFLPEVALQQRWDVAETLSALSLKAGLGGDGWRRDDARFEVFQTQHYGEGNRL